MFLINLIILVPMLLFVCTVSKFVVIEVIKGFRDMED